MAPQLRTANFAQALGVILTLAMAAVGCTAATAGAEGDRWRVVDPLTDPPTPIANATIIVNYHGTESVIVDSFSFCDRTEIVHSDEQGWFQPSPTQRGRIRVITPHKLDHAYPGPQFTENSAKQEVYLSPNQTRERRMKQMSAVSGAADCRSTGKSAEAFARLLDQVIDEMRSIVEKKMDREELESLEAKRDRHAKAAGKRS